MANFRQLGRTILAFSAALASPAAIAQLDPQATPLFADTITAGDQFGYAVAASPTSAYCTSSTLAVGVPGFDYGDASNAGASDVYCNQGNGFVHVGRYTLGAEDSRYGTRVAWGDFDNNGCADRVTGTPHADLHPVDLIDAGQVRISWCSPSTFNVTSLTQNTADVSGAAEAGDMFGYALAVGDFDSDGFDDLAVGVPFEDTSISNVGAVHVFFGYEDGLRLDSSQRFFYPGTEPFPDATGNENFGFSLAAGNIIPEPGTQPDRSELLIGAPRTTVDGVFGAGAMHEIHDIAFTSPEGSVLEQGVNNGGPDFSELDDGFGWALATGDFDCDGFDEVATSTPFEDYSASLVNAGAVFLIDYSPEAKSQTAIIDASRLSESSFRSGGAHPQDFFGMSLASGDMNNDGCTDLAIGAVGEDEDAADSGIVFALFGGSGLPYAFVSQVLTDEAPQALARFGWSLAIGQLDEGGGEDLVVGMPDAVVVGQTDAGKVAVFYSDTLFRGVFE